MRTRGETRTSQCRALLLYGEANRLDVDRISLLNGNVVAAGSHVRELHDDLFLVLFCERGLVIGFVAETVPFPRFSPGTVTVSFTLPDDGSTAVTSGAPCAKSNRPSVSRAAASRSANVRYLVERRAAI